MMHKPEDMLHMLKKETLSEGSKEAIKLRLSHVVDHDILRITQKYQPRHPMRFLIYVRTHVIPTVAGFVILALGATSVAAEGALPGDILYPIKVNVNESIRDALAVSDKAQAEWDARVAERRVEEVVTLAAKGKLTAETQERISIKFEERAQKADALLVRLADSGDADDVVNGRTETEAKLKAHIELLDDVYADKNTNSVDVSDIISRVNNQVEGTLSKREKVESKILTQKKEQLQASVDARQKIAGKRIKTAQKTIDKKIDSEVDETVVLKLETKITEATVAYARAEEAYQSEDYDVAFGAYQDAIRLAQEVETYARTFTSLKFNKNDSQQDDTSKWSKGKSDNVVDEEDSKEFKNKNETKNIDEIKNVQKQTEEKDNQDDKQEKESDD